MSVNVAKQPLLIDRVRVENVLGEGVLFHQQQQAVWWSDIKSNRLYRYSLASRRVEYWSMPEAVCSFGFVQDQEQLVLALASGFALYDLHQRTLTRLASPEAELPGNRFNDGRVDRQGRFWAGTMVQAPQEAPSSPLGALYRLECNGRCTRTLTGIEISNGLCWSPDSSKLYHADSPRRRISVYDFDPNTGDLSGGKVFAQTPPGIFPDGSTVDAQGYLWNAQWGGSRVVRYRPSGEVDQVVNLPVSQPTCVAIGGPSMDWLFVTTAREGLSGEQLAKEPDAGNLLIYDIGVRGLPESQVVKMPAH